MASWLHFSLRFKAAVSAVAVCQRAGQHIILSAHYTQVVFHCSGVSGGYGQSLE